MVATRYSAPVLLFLAIALPARAQTIERPRRLVIDPSVVQTTDSHRVEAVKTTADTPAASSFDVRPLIDSVTGALTATPHRRAADAALGTALIAFGARPHHPASSAVFLGVHALRLAAGNRMPTAWRGFDVQADVGKARVAITVQRTLGAAR